MKKQPVIDGLTADFSKYYVENSDFTTGSVMTYKMKNNFQECSAKFLLSWQKERLTYYPVVEERLFVNH